MYRHVLLAYDGSLESALALREGALIARRLGAEVFLLCVIGGAAELLMAEGAYGGVLAHQRRDYEALMARAVARLEEIGIRPQARLVEGEPTRVIAAVAREIAADLVVVGHHTQGLIRRWWTGSRHDYLTDHLDCSILIARNSMTEAAFAAEVAQIVAGVGG